MNRVLAVWRSVGQESLNLPNFITLTRILLIPVFVVLFATPTPDRSLSRGDRFRRCSGHRFVGWLSGSP